MLNPFFYGCVISNIFHNLDTSFFTKFNNCFILIFVDLPIINPTCMQKRCCIKDIFIWYNCRQLSIPSEILRKTSIIVEVKHTHTHTHKHTHTHTGNLLVSVQRVKEDRSCGDVSFKNNISQDTYIEI